MARGRTPRDDNAVAAKNVIGLRFTDEEKARMKQAADAAHQTLAGWIRSVALKAADRELDGKRRR